jgi:short-subunit dehydrogenase
LLGSDSSLNGKPGRIINISSIGGKIGFPLMAAYAGTTFALEGISESLRRELLIFGVDVIVIAPQSTNTPLIDKAEAQDPAPYESTPYREMIKHVLDFVVVEGRKGYMPEHIAKFVKLALVVKKPKPPYSVVPKPIEVLLLTHVFPTRLVDRLMAKQFGLARQD